MGVAAIWLSGFDQPSNVRAVTARTHVLPRPEIRFDSRFHLKPRGKIGLEREGLTPRRVSLMLLQAKA